MLWKLRLPTSVPYLFSSLRVAAAAAVIGAIIGEIPAGVADGLGSAIVNYNQYYVTAPMVPVPELFVMVTVAPPVVSELPLASLAVTVST